ncbi:MAG: glycoside hydrolase family 3 N-terminal domain-containing protein [Lachnospiraceae bacterium]|nr:glycoside hydrolase family 3 N-terminal domain-containing protein [Lachnospiraceae bacterium]
MVDLKKAPFCLNEEGIQWVEDTIASMSLNEKIGQLFVLMRKSLEPEDIKNTLDAYHQGGLRWQGGDRNLVYNQNKTYQEHSKIPLLIACNCDNGTDTVISDGTYVATPAAAGAGQTEETSYHMGLITGREATSVGCNWAFNPVVDIYMNWRNTIVNTRSFGSDPDEVIKHAKAYIRGVHESNMACCCKHFPGDGVEERDQHLVLGVNDLSVEEWDNSFRRVYQAMIDDGLESIMVGHIALPEMSRKLRPGIKDEEIMPATLSPELLTDLLRGEMGFNGLIITDASHMGGIACMEKREIAVPKAIASGCDMFLFSNDAEEDFNYMKAGIENGMISPERLDDALHRILGLKAKLKLYQPEMCVPDPEKKEQYIGCREHKELVAKAADQCVTLVKDTRHNLPVDPEIQKHARLVYIQSTPNSRVYKGDPVKQVIIEELERAGFCVDAAPNFYDLEVENGPSAENMMRMMDFGSMEEFSAKYDVVFLFVNVRGYAQENCPRIRLSCSHSSEMPWYAAEVPTIGISLNYTTHLFDLPQVHTFVNAYGCNRESIRAAIEKVCGRSQFKGVAEETVFCGKWDTRL